MTGKQPILTRLEPWHLKKGDRLLCDYSTLSWFKGCEFTTLEIAGMELDRLRAKGVDDVSIWRGPCPNTGRV